MKSGVYRIRNIVNQHCYIGSAVNIAQRWRSHLCALKNHKKAPPKLQNAWGKHGESAFSFEVIIYCDASDCLIEEQKAIDREKPYYNTRQIAESNIGVKWSEETNRKKHERHRIHTVNGITGSIKDLAERFAVVSYGTAWTRVKRGMSVADAVLTEKVSSSEIGKRTVATHAKNGTHGREVPLTAFGVTAPLCKLAPMFSTMSIKSVRQRILRGMDVESALTKPKRESIDGRYNY